MPLQWHERQAFAISARNLVGIRSNRQDRTNQYRGWETQKSCSSLPLCSSLPPCVFAQGTLARLCMIRESMVIVTQPPEVNLCKLPTWFSFLKICQFRWRPHGQPAPGLYLSGLYIPRTMQLIATEFHVESPGYTVPA